jgi:uncharacterized protein (DUF1330 family)
MGALLVVNYDVNDQTMLGEYRPVAGPLLVGEALGQVITISSDTVDLAEGTPAGSDTVVLRFASVEAAQAARQSDAYQAIINKRLNATTPKIAFIVPTMD